jgi:hypothetical protein
LIDGVKPVAEVNRAVEEQFVYAGPVKAEAAPPGPKSGSPARVPLTTRVRADYSTALKRASLERQLNGEQPNTLQDILEQALEPWLRTHGYLR